MTDVERELRRSYGRGAAAWAVGPSRVYALLADALVGCCPIPLTGRLVLDLGAGTGVASVAATAAGARLIASDVAAGMLQHDSRARPPAVCADAAGLCLRHDTFDAVIAACVLNHVPDLDAALAEARRVVRPGGAIVGSTFSTRQHPAKAAIDGVLARHGFEAPEWFRTFKTEREPLTGSAGKLHDAAVRVGLTDVEVHDLDVDLSSLDADGLAAYRLGMAHVVPFMDALDSERRKAIERAAAEAAAPTLAIPMPLLVLVTRVRG